MRPGSFRGLVEIMNINDRLRAAFDEFLEAPTPKPTPNALATKWQLHVQLLSGVLSVHQLYTLTEREEREPLQDFTARGAGRPKAEITKDLSLQKDLLRRFGGWVGGTPRGEWTEGVDGVRKRSSGEGQRARMELFLNSTVNPVDLGRYIKDDTLLQWFYRNRMPADVRQAMEEMMALDRAGRNMDITKLEMRHKYEHPKAQRIDCA